MFLANLSLIISSTLHQVLIFNASNILISEENKEVNNCEPSFTFEFSGLANS